VSDAAAWYREKHPSLPVGCVVPGKCFYCWQEISVGDRVVVRKRIAEDQPAQMDEKGTCKARATSEDGELFVVDLDSGNEAMLIRAELRKLRDNEV
jgi:hypothetical protein